MGERRWGSGVGLSTGRAWKFLLAPGLTGILCRPLCTALGGSAAACPFAIYTGRGSPRKESGRPSKSRNGKFVGPGAETGTRGGRNLRGGPGPAAINSGFCQPRSPAARSMGAGLAAGPGLPVPSLSAVVSAQSLSGQLCARSPASPLMVR